MNKGILIDYITKGVTKKQTEDVVNEVFGSNEKVVVGGCCLDLSDGDAGFYWDYILPKYRKKGYGSEMIQWRLSEAKKQGAQTAYAQCLQSSIGIYKTCGFQPTQPMSVFKRIS